MPNIKLGPINRRAVMALMSSSEARALVAKDAQRVTDACNSQSSWGGYDHADASSSIRARQHVWTIGRHDGTDTARARRLIANL